MSKNIKQYTKKSNSKPKHSKNQDSKKAITYREPVMSDVQFNDLKRSVYEQKSKAKSNLYLSFS